MTRAKTRQEEELEEQKLREISILLFQLFQREEATAKAIVGCLYDIATVNLINKYIRLWGINNTFKYIARFPRPIAKSLAVKLFVQPKCPPLITDWFYTLVEFSEQKVTIEPEILEKELLPALQQNKVQIKSLQGRVKLLTGSLLTTIVLFSTSIFWMAHNLQMTPIDLLTTNQASVKGKQ